jgi:hypothetical protein
MNWNAVARGAELGALIGCVIGVLLAVEIMRRRRVHVVAALTARGLTATRISPDWFHFGLSARFRVVASLGSQTITTAARVDRRGTVTWERELLGGDR